METHLEIVPVVVIHQRASHKQPCHVWNALLRVSVCTLVCAHAQHTYYATLNILYKKNKLLEELRRSNSIYGVGLTVDISGEDFASGLV